MYNFKHKMNWPELYEAWDRNERSKEVQEEMNRDFLKERFPKIMEIYNKYGIEGVQIITYEMYMQREDTRRGIAKER